MTSAELSRQDEFPPKVAALLISPLCVDKQFATIRLKLALDEMSPSKTEIETVEAPICPAKGFKVTVLLAPLPPKVMLLSGNSVGLLEVAVTDKDVATVSASSTVNGIAEGVSPKFIS